MVATSDGLKMATPYEVLPEGPITPQIFSYFFDLAKVVLDADNPGLPTTIYDYCHILLIAHYIAAKEGSGDKVSESIGDYSYTKTSGPARDYMAEYHSLIALYKAKTGTTMLSTYGDERRTDAEMKEVKISQSKTIFIEDSVEGEDV